MADFPQKIIINGQNLLALILECLFIKLGNLFQD